MAVNSKGHLTKWGSEILIDLLEDTDIPEHRKTKVFKIQDINWLIENLDKTSPEAEEIQCLLEAARAGARARIKAAARKQAKVKAGN